MPEYDKGNIFKQQSIMNNITHLQHVAIIINKVSKYWLISETFHGYFKRKFKKKVIFSLPKLYIN